MQRQSSYSICACCFLCTFLCISVANADPLINNFSQTGNFTVDEVPVFEDEFNDGSIFSSHWTHENLDGESSHKNSPYEGDNDTGRRWSAFYDNHEANTGFLDGGGSLVQRGIIDRTVSDPLRNESYDDPVGSGTMINFGDFKLYTSYLTTFNRTSDQTNDEGNYVVRANSTRFSPGHYFEIRVNFSNMSTFGHRHSFWLMPARVDAAGNFINEPGENYDDSPSNGVEIDIYEHEFFNDSSENTDTNRQRNNSLHMKVLGNTVESGGTGNTINDVALADANAANHIEYVLDSPNGELEEGEIEYRNTVVTGRDYEPSILSEGWHVIGLYWSSDKLVWFLNGDPVVIDSVNVPTTDMYMLLTREMNSGAKRYEDGATPAEDDPPAANDGPEDIIDPENPLPTIPKDHGMYGHNVAHSESLATLGQITGSGSVLDYVADDGTAIRDHVLVDYVKVWSINDADESESNSPPGAPLSITAHRSSLESGGIQWTDAVDTDGNVVNYIVKRNGATLATADVNDLTMDDLATISPINMSVTAIDNDGDEGPAAAISIPPHNATSGNLPPTAANNYRIQVYSTSALELFWDAATDPENDLLEYKVRQDGTEIYFGDGRSNFVNGLADGTEFTFTLTTHDSEGNESETLVRTATTNTTN